MTAPTLRPISNFDLLRALAAGIVVVGNGLVLTGGVPPGVWGAPLPRIGLDLLFAIGGYLAAESAGRHASWTSFAWGRVRRVFPALAVSVVLTAFVIGPLATILPLREYLLSRVTRHYLYNAMLLPHMFLPQTFGGQQWSGAANPMLWTLSIYAAGCAVILVLSRLERSWRGPAALLAAVACAIPHILQRPEMANALLELPFFFVGAALSFTGRGKDGSLWRADAIMLCFALTWIVATWGGEWAILAEWFTLPYMAVCFGRMTLPGLAATRWIGNPSFGMYLYAFPLQQLIVARLPAIDHPILLCLAGSIALGMLSWYAVERPAVEAVRLRSAFT